MYKKTNNNDDKNCQVIFVFLFHVIKFFLPKIPAQINGAGYFKGFKG